MVVKLTDDKKFLIVRSATKLELDQLKLSFTKEPADSWIIKKKNPYIVTKKNFMNQFNMIPTGLWLELVQICQKFGFELEFEDDFTCKTQNCTLTLEELSEYLDELFSDCYNDKGFKIDPMHYQVTGVYQLLKYKQACVEVTTSGGKTMMAYCLFKFLKDVMGVKKVLYVVPNSPLATQSLEKFYLYDRWCKREGSFKATELHSGITSKERKEYMDTDILFGTFQSLAKLDQSKLSEFDVIINDECLHPSSLIKMADGTEKQIKDVQIGDKVFTYNEESSEKEIHEVEYVYKNLSKHEKMYELVLEDDSTIKLTGNHKVLLASGDYKRTDNLEIGNEILRFDNSLKITNISEIEYHEDVYNLRIKSDNDLNHNYFANGICVSNCHHSSNNSIKSIISKCTNAEYNLGFTGTFPKAGSFESYTIQSYIGPIVYKLTANDLINKEKFATPIYIVRQILSYAQDEEKSLLYDLRKDKNKDDPSEGTKCLKQEQKYANKAYARLEYICNLASKTKQNTLILFGDIKGGYGRKIYDYLKERTDKQVFYSDGGTDSNLRDYYKAQMESDKDGNTILVASIYTFGEGCDIGNLWNIFLVNTAKSDRIVRQIIGRGMRPYAGKDKTIMFDFIDDFRYGDGYYSENYLYRHGKERLKIYNEHKFPVYTQEIKIEKDFSLL